MNRIVTVVAAAAIGVTAASGLGVKALMKPAPSSATFQMYANVDAAGDLGSNYGATDASVAKTKSTVLYFVRFSRPIGHCAAAAQGGKAGGSDPVNAYDSTVIATGSNTFQVEFSVAGLDATDPFMLTVTCAS